jgi:hypothetical protein
MLMARSMTAGARISSKVSVILVEGFVGAFGSIIAPIDTRGRLATNYCGTLDHRAAR